MNSSRLTLGCCLSLILTAVSACNFLANPDASGRTLISDSWSFTTALTAQDGIGGFEERLDSAGAPTMILQETPAEQEAYNQAPDRHRCRRRLRPRNAKRGHRPNEHARASALLWRDAHCQIRSESGNGDCRCSCCRKSEGGYCLNLGSSHDINNAI